MAEKLFGNGILFSNYGKSPSPLQDYHQIVVTCSEVIFRTWKITPRRVKAAPSEVKTPHEDFQYSYETQSEISRVFGKETLFYVSNLANGYWDYLARMPEKVLMKIITFLNLEDYNNLAQVSLQFSKVCKNEKLWEQMFYKHHRISPCSEIQELASRVGWKKLAFSNILQLRVQLSKHMKSKEGIVEAGTGDASPNFDILKDNFSVTSLRTLVSNQNFNNNKVLSDSDLSDTRSLFSSETDTGRGEDRSKNIKTDERKLLKTLAVQKTILQNTNSSSGQGPDRRLSSKVAGIKLDTLSPLRSHFKSEKSSGLGKSPRLANLEFPKSNWNNSSDCALNATSKNESPHKNTARSNVKEVDMKKDNSKSRFEIFTDEEKLLLRSAKGSLGADYSRKSTATEILPRDKRISSYTIDGRDFHSWDEDSFNSS